MEPNKEPYDPLPDLSKREQPQPLSAPQPQECATNQAFDKDGCLLNLFFMGVGFFPFGGLVFAFTNNMFCAGTVTLLSAVISSWGLLRKTESRGKMIIGRFLTIGLFIMNTACGMFAGCLLTGPSFSRPY